MEYSVVIPAAGVGSRMGLGYNKIFIPIGDKCIIEHAIINFIRDQECQEIIIACALDEEEQLRYLINCDKVRYVLGGSIRQESVLNGLLQVKSPYVLIHDGARPYLTLELLNKIKNELQSSTAVIPVISAKDAVIVKGQYVNEVKLVQTPQGFISEAILEAALHGKGKHYRDEGSLFHAETGLPLTFIDGDYQNIKITTQEDIKRRKL